MNLDDKKQSGLWRRNISVKIPEAIRTWLTGGISLPGYWRLVRCTCCTLMWDTYSRYLILNETREQSRRGSFRMMLFRQNLNANFFLHIKRLSNRSNFFCAHLKKTQFQIKLFAWLKEYFGSHLHAAALDAHSNYCVHRWISLLFSGSSAKLAVRDPERTDTDTRRTCKHLRRESNWQPYRWGNSANHRREVWFTKSNSEMPLVSNAECSQNKHNISIRVNVLTG